MNGIEAVVTNAAKTRKKGDIRKLADIFISDDVNDEMFDYLTKACVSDDRHYAYHSRIVPNNKNKINLKIHKIIYSGQKTIVIWEDGTKTIVSCGEGDQYDEYAGFCAAIIKKIFGSTSKAKKIMKQYIKERK